MNDRHVFLIVVFAFAVFAALGYLGYRISAHGVEAAPDPDRTVKVIFNAHVLDDLPVSFEPRDRIQEVALGEERHNVYVFENLSDETVRFRPIHSVAPPTAAANYVMTVCFCFNDQEIPPRGRMEFDVVYRFRTDMDPRARVCHVNYNLHRIDTEQMRPWVEGGELDGFLRDRMISPIGGGG